MKVNEERLKTESWNLNIFLNGDCSSFSPSAVTTLSRRLQINCDETINHHQIGHVHLHTDVVQAPG